MDVTIILGLETDVAAVDLSVEYEELGEVVATFVGCVDDVHRECYVFDIVIRHVPWYVGEENG